jgi:thioesterase domain-containing protein
MIDVSSLEQYLHEHIPLSKAMDVSVVSFDAECVVLAAPLAPNINHRETVFGGSASALGILAAWSLLHLRLRAAAMEARLVIQRNTMEYDAPIAGTFFAHATLASPHEWERFVEVFARRRKARIGVVSVLHYQERQVGRLTGDFVALG